MSPEQSIEEAWAELPFCTCGKVSCQHDIEMTRNVLMAVLDDIWPHGCSSSACGSVQPDSSIWRCRPCRYRARIAALGGDGDGR